MKQTKVKWNRQNQETWKAILVRKKLNETDKTLTGEREYSIYAINVKGQLKQFFWKNKNMIRAKAILYTR